MSIKSSVYLILLCLFALLLSAKAGSDDGDDDDSLKATNIILFLFFGLGLGILVTQMLSIWGEPVPYTVVIFILGGLFSLADNQKGTFGESVSDWVNINADLLLFVFLPPLIFGEAMSLNWYHVKGGLIQSIILAGPGVLIGAALMGVFAKLLLPYNWPWNFAMMFGSILSATDPVAVVALLKSVGASPKLTILIVGESLLNDGTAMVLFTIFYNSVNGKLYTPGSVLSFMFAASVGSVVFGIAMGFFTVRWLRTANRPLVETDITIQIAITISSAYITFFVAQNTFGVSGVLACCGAGAMLAWMAPPIILNHESMHNVWGMIEWSLNTTIFLLAGLIIGNRVLGKVRALDWFYLICFYVALMVIRFLTIGMLYPSIAFIGHRCSIKEAVFMSWAGLRGALGMALALIVENTCPKDIHDETSRLFFYVGGIAAITLVLNATTSKSLLLWLGLLKSDSAEKELVTSQIKRKLQRKTDKFIKQMAKDFEFTEEDIEEVRMSCTLLNDMNMTGLMRDTDILPSLLSAGSGIQSPLQSVSAEIFSRSKSYDPNTSGSMRISRSSMKMRQISRMLSMQHREASNIVIDELLYYVRGIFLEIVRVKYWHLIEEGKLPRLSFSAQFLLYSIDVALDQVEIGGGARDWYVLEEEINSNPFRIRVLKYYQSVMPPSLTNWSSQSLGFLEARKEKREVYMLSAFMEAHEHAQKKIHSFLGLVSNTTTEGLSEGGHIRSVSSTNEFPCPEENLVIEESRRAVEFAKARLSGMSADTVAAIRSKQAARLVLAKQAQLVKTMLNEGLLTAQHAEEFLSEITRDTNRIEKERNRMYRRQVAKKGKERQTEKEEEGGGRISFMSFLSEPMLSTSSRKKASLDKGVERPTVFSVQEGKSSDARSKD